MVTGSIWPKKAAYTHLGSQVELLPIKLSQSLAEKADDGKTVSHYVILRCLRPSYMNSCAVLLPSWNGNENPILPAKTIIVCSTAYTLRWGLLRPISHQLPVDSQLDDGADTLLLVAKPPRIETRGISMVGEGWSILVRKEFMSRVVEVCLIRRKVA